MIREFKIISIKEAPSARRIDDSEMHIDVQITKKWESGDLVDHYEDEVAALKLKYPVRSSQHLTTLLVHRKTEKDLEMGHTDLQKLWATIESCR